MSAEIYSAPEEIKVPNIWDIPDFNTKVYNELEEQYIKDCKKFLKERGYNEAVMGEILGFPVADGKALYMVMSITPKVMLMHLPLMDEYEFQYAHLMTPDEVMKKIQQQKNIAKLFGGSK